MLRWYYVCMLRMLRYGCYAATLVPRLRMRLWNNVCCVRRGKTCNFIIFWGYDGLGWGGGGLVTNNNILLLHPYRGSSYGIIATSWYWYAWWCTSAGATLVLRLHTADATLVPRMHATDVPHSLFLTAWRKNLGHLNAVAFLRHLAKI